MPSTRTPEPTARRTRPAPFSVRFPPDLVREIERDAEARGVSRNDWLAEAARRRLHPPPARRVPPESGCEHPRAALVSQRGGLKVCRLCGEKVKP